MLWNSDGNRKSVWVKGSVSKKKTEKGKKIEVLQDEGL